MRPWTLVGEGWGADRKGVSRLRMRAGVELELDG